MSLPPGTPYIYIYIYMAQNLISRQKPGTAVLTQQHTTLLYRNYGEKSIFLLRETGCELLI